MDNSGQLVDGRLSSNEVARSPCAAPDQRRRTSLTPRGRAKVSGLKRDKKAPHAATIRGCRRCLQQCCHAFKQPSEFHMIVRQSDLKLWNRCPLQYRWQHIDKLPRLQNASSVFGSLIHDAVLVLETTGDIDVAVRRFQDHWASPETLDPEYRIDYYVRGTSWRKFLEKGESVLRNWWHVVQWESDLVLAREYEFEVPIGDGHRLHGTVDKLVTRYRADIDQWVVLIVDFKTNAKVPTYAYLEEDLQFSAYAYASLQEEFWKDLPAGLYEKYRDFPRYGEWVALTEPKRMDAGIREERHFNRLTMAVNALADSVAMRIFVPNISGESCRYCDFRKQCGLPEIVD